MARDMISERFGTIESKIQNLVSQCENLRNERDSLKRRLAEMTSELEAFKIGDLDRIEKEKILQERVESLLDMLKAF